MSGGALVAKLGVVTLAAALTAGSLLALRQQRILAAHDLIQTQRRIEDHDKTLRRIRADIGTLSSPARVEKMAGALGPMRPIPSEMRETPGSGRAVAVVDFKPPPEPEPAKPASKPGKPGAAKDAKGKPKPAATLTLNQHDKRSGDQ